MTRRYDEFRFVWLLAMAATVAFIFEQSTLPPAESAEASHSVADALARFFGTDTAIAALIRRYVRKLAHFAEFFLLGGLSEGYLTRRHTVENTALQLAFGFLVASADESLQLLTGRGSLFSDVLLDSVGYLSGMLAAGLVLFPLLYYMKRKAGAHRADHRDA